MKKKMKKCLGLMCVMLLVLGGAGLVGVAHALSFSEMINFPGVELGKGAGAPEEGTYGWDHSTPADFDVPFDELISAILTIKIGKISEGRNRASVVVSEYNMDVTAGVLGGGNEYSHDIGSVFETWNASDLLHVDLLWSAPDETGRDNWLQLISSTFVLEYENGDPPPAPRITEPPPPIPEPATMLLIGSGLIGLAGFRRKFKK